MHVWMFFEIPVHRSPVFIELCSITITLKELRTFTMNSKSTTTVFFFLFVKSMKFFLSRFVKAISTLALFNNRGQLFFILHQARKHIAVVNVM